MTQFSIFVFMHYLNFILLHRYINSATVNKISPDLVCGIEIYIKKTGLSPNIAISPRSHQGLLQQNLFLLLAPPSLMLIQVPIIAAVMQYGHVIICFLIFSKTHD